MSSRDEFRKAEAKIPAIKQAETQVSILKSEYANAKAASDSAIANNPLIKFDVYQAVKFFSEPYYVTHYNDIYKAIQSGSVESGFQHFCQQGHRENRKPSPYFDPEYYLKQRPDVAKAIQEGKYASSAFHHYMLQGHREGTDPSPFFDEQHFLAHNPDVATAVMNGHFGSGAEYFNRFGAQEFGRVPSTIILKVEDKKVSLHDTSDIEDQSLARQLFNDNIVSVMDKTIEHTHNFPAGKFFVPLDLGLSFWPEYKEIVDKGGSEKAAVSQGIAAAIVNTVVYAFGADTAVVIGAVIAPAASPVVLALIGGATLVYYANKEGTDFNHNIKDMKEFLAMKIYGMPKAYEEWKAHNEVSSKAEDYPSIGQFQHKIDGYTGHAPSPDLANKAQQVNNAVADLNTKVKEVNDIIANANNIASREMFEDFMHGYVMGRMDAIANGYSLSNPYYGEYEVVGYNWDTGIGYHEWSGSGGGSSSWDTDLKYTPRCAAGSFPVYVENTNMVAFCGRITVSSAGE